MNDPKRTRGALQPGPSAQELAQRNSWFGALAGGVVLAVVVVVAFFFVRKHEDMALPALLGVVIVAAILKMLRSGWATKK